MGSREGRSMSIHMTYLEGDLFIMAHYGYTFPKRLPKCSSTDACINESRSITHHLGMLYGLFHQHINSPLFPVSRTILSFEPIQTSFRNPSTVRDNAGFLHFRLQCATRKDAARLHMRCLLHGNLYGVRLWPYSYTLPRLHPYTQ